MSTIITQITVNENNTGSMIGNAAAAGNQCLKDATIEPSLVNLMINIGVYRDDNIMEPSIASLIQQRMGLNLDPARDDITRRTLSFDLANGPCGFLNAVAVGSAILKNKPDHNILIVGGDAHPSGETRPDFPFSAIGTACILNSSKATSQGFGKVRTYAPLDCNHFGYSTIVPINEFGETGRSYMPITFEDGWVEKFCKFGAESIQRFLEEEGLSVDAIDGFVASQLAQGFPAELAKAAGLNSSTAIYDDYENSGNPHTSTSAMGLKNLLTNLEAGKKILIFEISSGFATTCAIYEA